MCKWPQSCVVKVSSGTKLRYFHTWRFLQCFPLSREHQKHHCSTTSRGDSCWLWGEVKRMKKRRELYKDKRKVEGLSLDWLKTSSQSAGNRVRAACSSLKFPMTSSISSSSIYLSVLWHNVFLMSENLDERLLFFSSCFPSCFLPAWCQTMKQTSMQALFFPLGWGGVDITLFQVKFLMASLTLLTTTGSYPAITDFFNKLKAAEIWPRKKVNAAQRAGCCVSEKEIYHNNFCFRGCFEVRTVQKS